MTALDAACQSAAALGITITVAAGDNGSSDGVTDGNNHVDFPASSPHVLACGGTALSGTVRDPPASGVGGAARADRARPRGRRRDETCQPGAKCPDRWRRPGV